MSGVGPLPVFFNIGGRTSVKGTFFPIVVGWGQIRVARGSKMGGMCGIRGVAAVHAQSFKKNEKVLRRVARQVLCLPRRKRWRADFPVRLVGSSRELFCAFLFFLRKYLGLFLTWTVARYI